LKLQRPPALGGAKTEVQKLNQRVELVVDQRLVERRERDGLRQAGAGLDEDKLGRGLRCAAEPSHHHIRRELAEIVGIVGAQFLLRRREGAHDAFDFTKRIANKLVDSTAELECPAAVHEPAFYDDLE
jgi:hypothetical protein